MPNPFPGMNPYIERHYWLNFHACLAVEIAQRLNESLPQAYAAVVEQETVVVDFDYRTGEDEPAKQVRIPDISVVCEPVATYGGSAVAEPPITLTTPRAFPEPYEWVEVIRVADGEVVTKIEILSPSNKRGKGRVDYLKKREEFLRSKAHLVEIDLLRSGQRLPVAEPLPPASYYVFLSRSELRPRVGIWPIALEEPLPTVPVPLDQPDPDAPLGLQTAVTAIYDKSRYDVLLDYSEPPPGPLTDSEREFILSRVADRASGKRTSYLKQA